MSKVSLLKAGYQGLQKAIWKMSPQIKKSGLTIAELRNSAKIIPNGQVNVFTKSGKITKAGEEGLKMEMQILGLPKNATWEQLIHKALQYREKCLKVLQDMTGLTRKETMNLADRNGLSRKEVRMFKSLAQQAAEVLN